MNQEPRSPRLLAEELEDGRLRRELDVGQPRAALPRWPAGQEVRLRFTGEPGEYFRIWVVNLLFTLLTLGIYSPWAKLRKAKWFAQHTELLGQPFDYHGDAWRILRGRLLLVAVGLIYLFAIGWSALGGLLAVSVVYLLLPWLLLAAQRFRLANTSWRGLRFGLDAPLGAVYIACSPVLVLALLAETASYFDAPLVLVGTLRLASGLLLPWTHARLKALQHGHAHYGAWRFSFSDCTNAFYAAYFGAFWLLVGVFVLTLMVLGMVSALLSVLWESGTGRWQEAHSLVATVLASIVFWPYMAARLQQTVWASTRCGELAFRGDLDFQRLLRVVLQQMALVVLSLGLYWPAAVVRLARHRIESMVVISTSRPLDELAAMAVTASPGSALGDGASDFANLDLGW